MSRDLQLFRIQHGVVLGPLIAGLFLWLLLPIAFFDIRGPAFQVIWCVHLFCQVVAVLISLSYLGLLLAQVGRLRAAIFLIVSAFFVMVVVARGLLPITARDALLYHLAVPRWWLQAGHIVEIPWHEWSHFPLLLSLGYAGFLSHQLELLTGFYHLSFLILCAGVVAAFLYYKCTDPELSLIGAFVCFSLPICLKVSVEPMSDLALAFYFGTAFLLFMVAIEQRWGRFALLCVGAFLGLALSVKYNSLLAAGLFPLVALLFLQRWKYSARESVQVVGTICLVAGIMYCPWLVRNFLATGNPVFPFLGDMFGTSSGQAFLGASKPLEFRLAGYRENWLEILFIPIRVLINGEDDNQRLFDGRLSPFLLLGFVPLLFVPKGERRSPWCVTTGIFVGTYFVSSFLLFYLLIRYQAPSLLLAVPLAVYGLKLLSERVGLTRRSWVLYGCVGVHLLWSVQYAVASLGRSGAGDYWGSNETATEFLNRRLDEYPLIHYVNTQLPENARVYLLYTGNRFYYYRRDVRGAYFSADQLITWLHAGTDSEGLRERYRREGITHLAIHGPRLRDTLGRSLSEDENMVWRTFASRYLQEEFVSKNISLLKIRSD